MNHSKRRPLKTLGLGLLVLACTEGEPGGAQPAGTAGAAGTNASVAGAAGTGSSPSGGASETGGAGVVAGTSAQAGSATQAGSSNVGGNGGMAGSSNTTAGSGGSATTSGANAGGTTNGGGGPTACTPARAHAAGTSTVTLQSGGTSRSYLLHIPPGYYGTKPLPLVFDVHGYTSFASEQLMRSKWDRMADKEGFVLIDPDGIDKSWNAGSCCGGNKQDDVAFFREMVKKATADLCIDSKRVYVSGHSNGGAMTYRLACEAADIFAAVAPVCGWLTVSACNPSRPIPVLAIRGLNDSTVKIDTADSDIDEWLSNDTCAKSPVTSSGVCKTYSSCAAGTQVMDCRPRGNHNFFYASNPDNYLVPDNAWPFFKQFALP